MSRRILTQVGDVIRLELALYRSLWRWAIRRPDVPLGAESIGYAQLVGPMLWLWVFGSVTETVVLEVLLRQIDAWWAEAIRLPLLILGVWGRAVDARPDGFISDDAAPADRRRPADPQQRANLG